MRKYLDEYSTINTIRLELRHPAGKKYLWTLVEGETDQKLFSKLIDGDNTKVEMVHGGVESLRKALSELIKETTQVIGIRDADFLHLNQQQETIDHLFLTDVHDAEMMMLLRDTVFEAVVAEYLPDRRNDFAVLRDELLASLVFLAGLRWLNNIECLEFNFKAGIAHFYDPISLAIDRLKCIERIEQCSPNKKRTLQIQEIDNKITGVTDYYNLCHGHDFESALVLHVNAKKSKNVKNSDIGAALRLAYRKEDFATTTLYCHLKSWEVQTGSRLFSNT